MLTKLIKYELKATARLLIPLYIILLCVTILNRIVLRLEIYTGILRIIPALFTFVYITLTVVIIIVTFLLMIIRFYKNLLSEEGYLMFTLPVKPHQLISSKIIVTMFWVFMFCIAALSSIYFVFATPDKMKFIMQGFREGLAEINAVGGNGNIVLIEFIILCILGLIANILLIYVSIAIGQLFSGHKIIGSFLSYIAIYTALQIFLLAILIIFGMLNMNNLNSFSTLNRLLFPVCIVFELLLCAGFFSVTNSIFTKKLNLE